MISCAICVNKMRGISFPYNLAFWYPTPVLYYFQYEDRMIYTLLCKSDFYWAAKNKDIAESIIMTRVKTYHDKNGD